MAVLGLALVRIWLTADEGIGARNALYDDLAFIRSAAVGCWGFEKFDYVSVIRAPAYPLWLWVNMKLEIPQRIGIDTAYVASALLLAYALRRVGMSAIWTTITFAVVAFAPETFRLFRIVLSDCLMAVLMNAVNASLLLVIVSPRKTLWGIVAGVFAGLFALTRGEGAVLALAMCACVGGVLFLQTYFAKEGFRRAVCCGIRATAVPVVLLLLITNAAKYANYRVYGVYALTILDAPGHTAMIKALTRISPSQRIEYVSISQESLQRAYDVSSSFRELQPYMEGTLNKQWHDDSAGKRRIPDREIVTGVNQWQIHEAAQNAGKYTSGAEVDAFYAQIAKDVNAAIDSGELPGRLVVSSFIDPDLGWWVPRLGQSLGNIWRCSTRFGAVLPVLRDGAEVTEKIKEEFDQVCVRDPNRNPEASVVISGTVTTRDMPAKRIQVFNQAGMLRLASSPVTGIEPIPATQPTFRGLFKVEIPRAPAGLILQWRAMLGNDKEFAAERPLPDKRQTIPLPKAGEGTRIEVNNVEVQRPPVTQRLSIRRQIASAYDYLSPAIIIAGPVVAFCAIVVRRRRLRWEWLCCTAVLVFGALSRLGLFTIIDATSWQGDQQRYIFPAVPVLLACGLLMISGGLSELFGRRQRDERANADAAVVTK